MYGSISRYSFAFEPLTEVHLGWLTLIQGVQICLDAYFLNMHDFTFCLTYILSSLRFRCTLQIKWHYLRSTKKCCNFTQNLHIHLRATEKIS